MADDTQLVLIGNVFRIACLMVGFGFAYLGYRLYVKGVFDKTQDINASFGDAKVALRHVAPGVVFGIAGIVVSILSVVRPIQITTSVPPASFQKVVTKTMSNSIKPVESEVTIGNDKLTLEEAIRRGCIVVGSKGTSMKGWPSPKDSKVPIPAQSTPVPGEVKTFSR
ncbi:MAG TPA: hypothetical protein VKE24_05395 [Candidatus Acidoferrales bacterium]|nr:hypothetical protein [Candidatus Acidoferrales bacterium]